MVVNAPPLCLAVSGCASMRGLGRAKYIFVGVCAEQAQVVCGLKTEYKLGTVAMIVTCYRVIGCGWLWLSLTSGTGDKV